MKILNKYKLISLLKNQNFFEAYKLIEKSDRELVEGVRLDNLASEYPLVKCWIPSKSYLMIYIEFIKQLNFHKKFNLAFKLSYGIAVKFENNVEANLLFSQICIDKKLFKLGERYILKAVKLKEDDFRILNCCGIIHCKLGKLTEAKDYFLKAIEKSPNSHQSYLNLSGVYMRLNESNECESSLKKAILLNPKYIEAWTALAQFRLLNNDESAFFAALNEINKIDPSNKHIVFLKYAHSIHTNKPNKKLLDEWFQKCADEFEFPDLNFIFNP